MKPPPHRNPKPRNAGKLPHDPGASIVTRPSRMSPRYHPESVRFHRYPSLSDDHYPPIISPRLIAGLIFVAIIIALLIGA